MPWIELPSQFHPVNSALVGKITYRQAPMQGAVAQPAQIAVYEFGQPEVIPMYRVDTGGVDIKAFPQSFLGALIFINGTEGNGTYYATYGFQEQFGVIRLVMKLQQGIANIAFHPLALKVMGFKKNSQAHAGFGEGEKERPKNPDQVLPQVYTYLNQWMQNYLQQSGGGQTPHV